MTTDVSLLDDSVFETSQENGLRKKRLRNRSLGNGNGASAIGYKKPAIKHILNRHFSDDQPTDVSLLNQLKEQFCSTPTKVLSPLTAANMGFDAHIMKDYSDLPAFDLKLNQTPPSEVDIGDNKAAKLGNFLQRIFSFFFINAHFLLFQGNIPEEALCESDENLIVIQQSPALSEASSISKSPSKTPTKSLRTIVTENDPLGGLSLDSEDIEVNAPLLSEPSSIAGTPLRKQQFLEKKPFEDDFKNDEAKSPDGTSEHYGFLGFSRLGRDSVRGFLNRLSGTPMSKLTKSYTVDSSMQNSAATTPSAVTEPSEEHETVDDPVPSSPTTASDNTMALSPSLTHLMTQAGAKMLSKMDVIQKHSASLVKTSVSSVYKEIRNMTNLDQIGSPLRGSLSSIAMAAACDASGMYLTPDIMPLTSDDAWSLKDDECSGLWLKNAEESSANDGCSSELPLNDPAFQLSSGDTGYLINFDNNNPTFSSQNDVVGKNGLAYNCAEILLCTCTKCPNCLTYCYDDEILAGFMPDDSELKTVCQFCCKFKSYIVKKNFKFKKI